MPENAKPDAGRRGTLLLVGSPSCFVIVALWGSVETSTNFGDTLMNIRSQSGLKWIILWFWGEELKQVQIWIRTHMFLVTRAGEVMTERFRFYSARICLVMLFEIHTSKGKRDSVLNQSESVGLCYSHIAIQLWIRQLLFCFVVRAFKTKCRRNSDFILLENRL